MIGVCSWAMSSRDHAHGLSRLLPDICTELMTQITGHGKSCNGEYEENESFESKFYKVSHGPWRSQKSRVPVRVLNRILDVLFPQAHNATQYALLTMVSRTMYSQ
jgi:hypothetical protein